MKKKKCGSHWQFENKQRRKKCNSQWQTLGTNEEENMCFTVAEMRTNE